MINFGDSNLIIQYIQNFLKNKYDKDIELSDKYDELTHELLIDYLKQPEILDSFSLKNLLINKFTLKEKKPPYKLIDDGGLWNFDFDITLDSIRFFNRPISRCFEGAIHFIQKYLSDVELFIEKFGWNLFSKSSLNVNNLNEKRIIEFTLTKNSQKQILPCKELIKMINLSTNKYLINKCFLDENNSYHGFINQSNNYKILYIPAKSGEKFTIAHGYKYACEIAIGYTDCLLSDLINGTLNQVYDIVSFMNKSTNGELKPEDYYVYEIPEDVTCTYLLIQMPHEDKLISPISQEIKINLGDINQDGVISVDENDENSDYSILKDYVYAIKNGKTPKHNLSGINLLAANLNGDIDIIGNSIIDENDLKIFESQLKMSNYNKSLNFGKAVYEKEINLTESDYNRLLIIYGDITENNKNNELNIPIYEFQENPWAIHDCFLPYILNSCIHNYSNISDIKWLQEQIQKIESHYEPIQWGFYDSPNDYISENKISWNEQKGVYEYIENDVYSGYILNSNDIYNANLIRESNLTISDIKIVNGKFLKNKIWTGEIVLSNGVIANHLCAYSLREIIKKFQININKHYKNQNFEQIKFINGFVDPLTERYLKQAITNL